jgi:ribosomal protein L37AE/L43A
LNDLREGDKEAPSECPKCGPNRTILKKKHKGEKVWKCADCEHRWPRSPSEAPQKPSKALDKPVRSKAPGKNKPAKQRPAKKGVRGKKKAPV